MEIHDNRRRAQDEKSSLQAHSSAEHALLGASSIIVNRHSVTEQIARVVGTLEFLIAINLQIL